MINLKCVLLGEMNAQELSETTMDIEQRHLWQVTVDQIVETGRLMSVLMSDNVELQLFLRKNINYSNGR